MEIRSLGLRTHVMVHRLGGSIVERRDDALVVRTAANPGYYWGNFLLAPHPPTGDDAPRWLRLFAAEFPDARHVAIGVDGTDGALGESSAWRDAGLEVEADVVLTADEVHAPGRHDESLSLRALSPDDEESWAGLVRLRLDTYPSDDTGHAEFVTARVAQSRLHVADGHGAYVVALDGDVVRAGLGLVTDGGGLGRYQTVETHPDFRRRGLAGALLQLAADTARRDLGVRRFVIVADPDYVAIELYRRAGFTDVEREVKWERVGRD